jgi:predicted small lipoprotein YifL
MEMVRRFATLMIAGVVLAGLGGCGQKGPLYLPDKGGTVVTRPGGQAQQTQQSPETAPQPATPPQPDGTEGEKKNQAPPPRR